MKKIIRDSMLEHLLMFFLIVFTLLEFHFSPITFISIGVLYVFLIFDSAMSIAEFEMSESAKILEKLQSGKYERVEINWHE